MGDSTKGDILIIGGGISGISAAVEIAEFGHHVTMIEKRFTSRPVFKIMGNISFF